MMVSGLSKAAALALLLFWTDHAAATAQPRPPGVGAAQATSTLGLPRLRRSFDLADTNRNGRVSRREFVRWYGQSPHRRSPLTWRLHASRLFDRMDTNKDRFLDPGEFLAGQRR